MSGSSSEHFGVPTTAPFLLFTDKPCFQPVCSRAAPLLAARFLRLQQVGRNITSATVLPPSALDIQTPLNVDTWSSNLLLHPNQLWVSSLLAGLQEGVRIGINPALLCRSARANMQSAVDHPAEVQQYLAEELKACNLAGPFTPSQVQEVIINRFGVIPKAHKPGRWRLIMDLSHPQGFSVNDGVSAADSSMVYSLVDDAAHIISSLSRNAIMAKTDISSAFRIIPVHPQDCPLFGMCWENNIYI